MLTSTFSTFLSFRNNISVLGLPCSSFTVSTSFHDIANLSSTPSDTALKAASFTANLAAYDMSLETAVSEPEGRAAHRTCKRGTGIGQGCQRMLEHL